MTTLDKITAGIATAVALLFLIATFFLVADIAKDVRAIRQHYEPPAKVEFRWTPSSQQMEPEILTL